MTSKYLSDWVIQNDSSAVNIELCYTTVDPEAWAPSVEFQQIALQRWGIYKDTGLVLFAGRFCDQKQVRLLPEILAGILTKRSEAMLVLAGDGPELPWLEENLLRKYPFNSKYVGPLDPDELKMALSATDILILPSKNEGIALILFEAMSMEVVPVATNVGGQPELIDTECGVLVENGPELAQNMASEVCSLLGSPEVRKRKGRMARQRVTELSRSYRPAEIIKGLLDRGREDRLGKNPDVEDGAIDACRKTAIRILRQESEEARTQSQAKQEGKTFPGFFTNLAEVSRKLPVIGRGAVWLEHRYGDRIGRFIMRWT